MHFYENQSLGPVRPGKGLFQFPFRPHVQPQSPSEYFWKFVVMPRLDIVVGMVHNYPLDRVTVVIKKKDDGFEPVANEGGKFLASDLE
jgi:hypothetical protein